MDADQIIELLRHKHQAPEWATFAELANATGGARRYIDFYAMNLWPSSKHKKIAYEIKVSRSDFMRELDRPAKRAFSEQVANECYFAMQVGIIKALDEIPEGWGLIEATKGGMRIKKRAQYREIEPLSEGFLMAIARRTSDPKPKLPVSTWVYAGKELNQDQLLEVATGELQLALRIERDRAITRYKQRDDYRSLLECQDYIKKILGLNQWRSLPEGWQQRIDGMIDGESFGHIGPLEALEGKLKSLRDSIDEAASVLQAYKAKAR